MQSYLVNYWNPLSSFIETEKAPAARILRTSFQQKMADTFHLFSGDEEHLGVIDYLTLGLSRITYRAAVLSKKLKIDIYTTDPLSNIFGQLSNIIISMVNIGLHALAGIAYVFQGVTACVGQVLTSPVVLVTHLITSILAQEDYQNALNLRINQPVFKPESEHGPSGIEVEYENCTLKQFLNRGGGNNTVHPKTLEDLMVKIDTAQSQYLQSDQYGGFYSGHANDSRTYLFFCPDECIYNDLPEDFKMAAYLEINQNQQAEQLKSLKKLNIGHVINNTKDEIDIDNALGLS